MRKKTNRCKQQLLGNTDKERIVGIGGNIPKEVVTRDLPSEEVHAPIEEIGKVEDASTKEVADSKSVVLQSVGCFV